jgi:hypothetical protein
MFESVALTLPTAGSTLFGGLLALKLTNRASSLLAITAGVLRGVVFFDGLIRFDQGPKQRFHLEVGL